MVRHDPHALPADIEELDDALMQLPHLALDAMSELGPLLMAGVVEIPVLAPPLALRIAGLLLAEHLDVHLFEELPETVR